MPQQRQKKLQYHWEIDAYKLSVQAAMEIYELSKSFSDEEKYRLTDQIRKSSRSVSAQIVLFFRHPFRKLCRKNKKIAEGWRRRKYRGAFVNKMNEAESKAAETQVWLEYAAKCQYISKDSYTHLHYKYQEIIGKLINMGNHPEQWCFS